MLVWKHCVGVEEAGFLFVRKPTKCASKNGILFSNINKYKFRYRKPIVTKDSAHCKFADHDAPMSKAAVSPKPFAFMASLARRRL